MIPCPYCGTETSPMQIAKYGGCAICAGIDSTNTTDELYAIDKSKDFPTLEQQMIESNDKFAELDAKRTAIIPMYSGEDEAYPSNIHYVPEHEMKYYMELGEKPWNYSVTPDQLRKYRLQQLKDSIESKHPNITIIPTVQDIKPIKSKTPKQSLNTDLEESHYNIKQRVKAKTPKFKYPRAQ